MSLKELTQDKHREAEQTKFMQAVIEKQLPEQVWTDFIYQKILIYKGLERLASEFCEFDEEPSIYRLDFLKKDFRELCQKQQYHFRHSTVAYYNYIQTLINRPSSIIPHIYVWHMGDLYGGQMIRRLTPGSNLALQFDDRDRLISFIRSKCDDSMAPEANIAFDHAIKIMNELF